MARKARILVADVEAALRASAGVYSVAASILAQKYGSCAPNTVKNYIRRSPRLQAIEEEITDQTLDLAETKLVQKINDGNMTAIIFYLKTKGRHRGWIERREIEGVEGGTPIQVYLPDNGRDPDLEKA